MSFYRKWHAHSMPDELVGNWDMLGEDVFCPECGKACTVEYDEYYDYETDEESGTWFLEEP